ncbi:hypothetical protein P154DRAFT_99730 [Amniculicola lignicola CBS 123094]|uniref:Uncharacterized protein n=1 Tax=Amniculicola lignicola CBS 123094 TaxID=1392246 RepID=A0A6A5WQ68_9PLEO|nr:hypothetical protein P154DRAFT_99730 [Amniculicola lignicola CBS 123094]
MRGQPRVLSSPCCHTHRPRTATWGSLGVLEPAFLVAQPVVVLAPAIQWRRPCACPAPPATSKLPLPRKLLFSPLTHAHTSSRCFPYVQALRHLHQFQMLFHLALASALIPNNPTVSFEPSVNNCPLDIRHLSTQLSQCSIPSPPDAPASASIRASAGCHTTDPSSFVQTLARGAIVSFGVSDWYQLLSLARW